MRKLMKTMAVLLALVMLISVVSISASADAQPTIALSGRTEASTGDTYKLTVTLNDGGNVGGVQGTITYNKAVFDYDSADFETAFTNAGNDTVESTLSVSEETGEIKFVALTSGVTKMFVINFTIKAAGTGSFTVKDIVGSNLTGTEQVTVTSTPQNAVTRPDILFVNHAELKAVADDPDLRFSLDFDMEKIEESFKDVAVEKFGVLVGLWAKTQKNGVELTVDMGSEYASSVVDADLTELGFDGGEVYINIANSHNNSKDLLGVRYSIRAYVTLANGTTIYSNNDNPFVQDGYSSKSMIGCAKAAAANIANNEKIPQEDRTKLATYGSYSEVLPLTSEDGSPNKTELLGLIETYSSYFFPDNNG